MTENFISLSSIIDWRVNQGVTKKKAFTELCHLCWSGKIRAIGIRTNLHPKGPKPLPEGYSPYIDPPIHRDDILEVIPEHDWKYLWLPTYRHDSDLYSKDGLFSDRLHLAIWISVEFPQKVISIWGNSIIPRARITHQRRAS